MKNQLWWFSSIAVLTACQPIVTGAPCTTTDNCPSGQSCVTGKCEAGSGLGGGSGGGTPGGGSGGSGGGAVAGGGGGATGGGGGALGGGGGTLGGGAGGDDAGMDAGSAVSDGGLAGTPASHDFGDIATAATSPTFTFGITNAASSATGTLSVSLGGTGAPVFNIDRNTCTGSLGAGGSCNIGISFLPAATGAATATLDLSGMPGGALSFGLIGNGILPATLTISPTTQAFGSVALGSSSTVQTFTVRNVGGTATGVVGVSTGGINASEFIITNSCTGVLAPMTQCTFTAVFAPSSAGLKAATAVARATPGGAASANLTATGLAPAALSGLPTPGVFAATVQGQDSSVVSFTITNGGGATSPSLTTTIGGTNGGDFLPSADTCNTATVAASNTCVVSLRFHPLAPGSRNGTLTVTGAGLVPVVIPLGGTGLTPALLSMSPSGTVNFGDVASNGFQSLSFGVTNLGQGTSGVVGVVPTGAGFSVINSTCTGTLAGGASCDFVVRFSPGSLGVKNGTLVVSASPGGTQNATLTGNGVAPGALTITPVGLDFGDVVVGQTGPAQSFTVRNTGGVATTVPTVSIGGSGMGFSQSNTCTAALASMATCTVSVTFAPVGTTRNTQSGFVQVSATTGGTASGNITGNAQAPASLSILPTSASFANTTVGSTGPSTLVTVTNNGDQLSGPLSVSMTTADFVVVPSTGDCRNFAMPGLTSCSLRIAFSPQASGARSGALNVGGVPGGTVTTTLTGTGLTPANLTLTPNPGLFGNVLIGAFATRPFVVSNTGQTPSGPLAINLTGPDQTSFQNVTPGGAGDCVTAAPLAPGASCNLTIRFNAGLPQGNKSATLTASAAPGGAPNSVLSGTAQRPAVLNPANTSFDFGGVEVGTGSVTPFDWVLTNGGDVPTSGLTTLLQPGFAALSDTCNGQSVAPAATCTVRVVFSPGGPGSVVKPLTVAGTGVSATLAASGVGMWRLTVRPVSGGTVETLDGLISNCAPASTANCTALYLDGAGPSLRARTGNNGFHFSSWASPIACTGYGIGAVCLLSMTSSLTALPVFSSNGANLAFVTSSTVPANLGGVAPYDALCNAYASDAGINNAGSTGYVAWISVVGDAASNRLTATGGQVRLDDTAFVTSKVGLLASAIRYPANLDELGRKIVGNDSIWTGTNSSGTPTMLDCMSWSINTVTGLNRGIPSSGPGYWTDGTGGHTCNNLGTRILCLGNTSGVGVGLTGVPFSAKRIFRSTPVTMQTPANANAQCSAQATAAGLPAGTYRALMASQSVSAATNALLVDTMAYHRVDGTYVGTGAEIKVKKLRSGIWQNADGTFPLPSAGDLIWTGAPDPNTPGTLAETCLNWTSTGGFTRVGRAPASAGNFFDTNGNGNPCTNSWGLYCVEQ